MFDGIQYVTSGLTLLAFLGAITARLLQKAIQRREGLINAAKGKRQLEIIEVSLERFHIDTTDLSPAQKVSLLRERMHSRERAARAYLLTSLAALLILSTATIVVIWREGGESSPGSQKQSQNPMPDELTREFSSPPELNGEVAKIATPLATNESVLHNSGEQALEQKVLNAVKVVLQLEKEPKLTDHLEDSLGANYDDRVRILEVFRLDTLYYEPRVKFVRDIVWAIRDEEAAIEALIDGIE